VSLSSPTKESESCGVLPPKSKEAIDKYFPGAMKGHDVENLIHD